MVKAGLIKWGVASVSSYMVPEVVLEKLEPMKLHTYTVYYSLLYIYHNTRNILCTVKLRGKYNRILEAVKATRIKIKFQTVHSIL